MCWKLNLKKTIVPFFVTGLFCDLFCGSASSLSANDFNLWAINYCVASSVQNIDEREFSNLHEKSSTCRSKKSLVWKWSQNDLRVHKWKKCWFSTNKFSKLPLRISCLIITVMEVQIVLYDNLRTFRGMKDFRLKYRLKYKKWNS